MTQATVTRATTAGSFRLPASRRRGPVRAESAAAATGSTRVDVVTPVETRRLGSGVFAFLCGLLLVAGLVTVLLLNTARAQQSYTLGDLQSQRSQLTDSKQELDADIDSLSSPQTLALAMLRAGYVPAHSVRYVDKSSHKLLGVSTVKSAGSYSVLTLPSTPASAVANQAVKLADSGLLVQTASPSAATKPTVSASASAKPSAPAMSSPTPAASATTTTATDKPSTKTTSTTTAKPASPAATAAPSAAPSAAPTR